MSEAKHTPGEWEADINAGYVYVRVAPLKSVVIAATESAGSPEEEEANLHLLAASKRMLGALKATLDHPLVRMPGDLEIIIREAIAKAEGRS